MCVREKKRERKKGRVETRGERGVDSGSAEKGVEERGVWMRFRPVLESTKTRNRREQNNESSEADIAEY